MDGVDREPKAEAKREVAEVAVAGASAEFIVVVYDELRRLAAHRMAAESEPQTLDATALVHEAWMRIAKPGSDARWSHKRHFFNAAAEAMRRILIDRARARNRQKRGGDLKREEFHESRITAPCDGEDLLALNEALDLLAMEKPELLEIVRLRYFVGLGWDEIEPLLGLSQSTLRRKWLYAKAWLRRRMDGGV